MSSYIQLIDNLEKLKLTKIKEYISNYLDENIDKQLSVVDILKELTEKELEFREERAAQVNIKISNFPYQKRIDDFDFNYQPSINKNQILDFCSLRFIETQSNILFIGTSGVGKTHLATSIGIEAASKRISTYFIHFNDLINKLKKAYLENRHEAIIKHYATKYKLLIIDEIGYLPIEKEYANLFFQIIAARYEKKSTIITTNQPLSKWGEVFNDNTIATAIIDRLVHHSAVVKVTGKSYRIKDMIIDEPKKGND